MKLSSALVFAPLVVISAFSAPVGALNFTNLEEIQGFVQEVAPSVLAMIENNQLPIPPESPFAGGGGRRRTLGGVKGRHTLGEGGGLRAANGGTRRELKGSQKKGECDDSEFKIIINLLIKDFPIGGPIASPFEGEGAVGDFGKPGTTLALSGLSAGLELSWEDAPEPIEDEKTFEEFFEGISGARLILSQTTGACTAMNDNILADTGYCTYSIDYIGIGLDFDIDFPFLDFEDISVSQLTAAGSLQGIGNFGVLGFTPVTGTAFNLAGTVDGGDIGVFGTSDYDFFVFVGILPFTQAASCFLNSQLEIILELLGILPS